MAYSPINQYGFTASQWSAYSQNGNGMSPQAYKAAHPELGFAAGTYVTAGSYQGAYPWALDSERNAAAYDAWSKANVTQPTYQTAIDPQKQSGYKFAYAMSNEDNRKYLDAKDQSGGTLTEYTWRKANGKDTSVTSGAYTVPEWAGHSTQTVAQNADLAKQATISQAQIKAAPKVITSDAAKEKQAAEAAAKAKKAAEDKQKAADAAAKLAKTNADKAAAAEKQKIADAAKETAAAAAKALAAKHPGQVQLKDGSWVSQVQKGSVSSSVGQSSIKIQEPDNISEAQRAANYASKQAGTYKPVSRQDITDGKKDKVVVAGTIVNRVEADKVAAQLKAIAAAEELAAAMRDKAYKSGSAFDKSGNALNQITDSKGRDIISDATHKLQVLTPVDLTESQQKKTKAVYESLKSSGKTKAGKDITESATAEGVTYYSRGGKSTAYDASLQSARLAEDVKTSGLARVNPIENIPNILVKKTSERDRLTKLAQNSNPIIATSAKLSLALETELDFGNVTTKANHALDTLNKMATDATGVHGVQDFINARDSALSKHPMLANAQKSAVVELKKHETAHRAVDWLQAKTDLALKEPVTTAGVIGTIYAGGVVSGALFEGALGASEAGAASLAAKAGSKLLTSGVRVIRPAANVVMGAGVVDQGLNAAYGTGIVGGAGKAYKVGKAVYTGDVAKAVSELKSVENINIERLLVFSAEAGIGLSAMKKGAKVAKDPISIIPGVETVRVQEVYPGADPVTKDIKLGETFSIGGKPIISHGEGKFVKGSLTIPEAVRKGKMIQPYTATGKAAFEKTITEQMKPLEHVYYIEGKAIADAASKAKSPITKPTKFEVTSAHIPDSAKPTVKRVIQNYPSTLKGRSVSVYGSVAQKAQMEGYLTRVPGDIEVSASSVDKFVKMFETQAKKDGLKKGTDYKITGNKDAPKIEFKNENGEWEKGVEVFAKNHTLKQSDYAAGRSTEGELPFGYKQMKNIKVDKTRLMKLQEQAERKFSGATTMKGETLEPVHSGRIKDVRDLIEIGVGYKLETNNLNEKSIIDYTIAAAAKYPDILDSPIVDFINTTGRLPTKEEIGIINGKDPVSKSINAFKEVANKFSNSETKGDGSTSSKKPIDRGLMKVMNKIERSATEAVNKQLTTKQHVSTSRELVGYVRSLVSTYPRATESKLIEYINKNGRLPTKNKLAELVAADKQLKTRNARGTKAGETGKRVTKSNKVEPEINERELVFESGRSLQDIADEINSMAMNNSKKTIALSGSTALSTTQNKNGNGERRRVKRNKISTKGSGKTVPFVYTKIGKSFRDDATSKLNIKDPTEARGISSTRRSSPEGRRKTQVKSTPRPDQSRDTPGLPSASIKIDQSKIIPSGKPDTSKGTPSSKPSNKPSVKPSKAPSKDTGSKPSGYVPPSISVSILHPIIPVNKHVKGSSSKPVSKVIRIPKEEIIVRKKKQSNEPVERQIKKFVNAQRLIKNQLGTLIY